MRERHWDAARMDRANWIYLFILAMMMCLRSASMGALAKTPIAADNDAPMCTEPHRWNTPVGAHLSVYTCHHATADATL